MIGAIPLPCLFVSGLYPMRLRSPGGRVSGCSVQKEQMPVVL